MKPNSPSLSKLLSPEHILNLTPGVKMDLKSRYFADWGWFEAGRQQERLAHDIHKKLLAGAKNEIRNSGSKSKLNLAHVAELLAEIASCRSESLGSVARQGLQRLGLSSRNTRGRPQGRRSDIVYRCYVEGATKLVAEKGVFDLKANLTRAKPKHWQPEFLRRLQSEGWSEGDCELFTNLRNPASFAKHKAAICFNVTYEAVDRAVRRYGKRPN